MKEISEHDAYLRLASLCATAEHCQWEMREKMRRWELSEESQSNILSRLLGERYIDDERYARCFVNDKIKYNKWGRHKIEQSLRLKHIDEAVQARVLNEIDDEEYLSVLRPLLKSKAKTTRATSAYELKQKLMRFAVGRGFTIDLILKCIDD